MDTIWKDIKDKGCTENNMIEIATLHKRGILQQYITDNNFITMVITYNVMLGLHDAISNLLANLRGTQDELLKSKFGAEVLACMDCLSALLLNTDIWESVVANLDIYHLYNDSLNDKLTEERERVDNATSYLNGTCGLTYTLKNLKLENDQIFSAVVFYVQKKNQRAVLLLADRFFAIPRRLEELSNGIYDNFLAWITSSNEEYQKTAMAYFVTVTTTFPEWKFKSELIPGFIDLLLQFLETKAHLHMSLQLLFNFIQHSDTRPLLSIDDITQLLTKLSNSDIDTRAKAQVLAITTLVSDPDKLTIVPEDTLVDFLQQTIHNNVANKASHCDIYASILPLMNLSVSDKYKGVVGNSMLPLLTVIEMSGDSSDGGVLEKTRNAACKTLWNLMFKEVNKLRFRTVQGPERLLKLCEYYTTSKQLVENINGVLWTLDLKPNKARAQQIPVAQQQQGDTKLRGGHIMISYNWSVQPLVLKLASSLKAAGFSVWLDVEQMKGSTLDAMASAVEGSSLVLLCMTEKYKESPNCRLEGEYTHNTKKPFIPLLMQSKYKPNGWLGFLLGAKLYHDFSDEKNWDTKIGKLTKEINEHTVTRKANALPAATLTTTPSVTSAVLSPAVLTNTASVSPMLSEVGTSNTVLSPSKAGVSNTVASLSSVSPSVPSSGVSVSNTHTHVCIMDTVRQWSIEQVGEWLEKSKLGHLRGLFEKHKINGAGVDALSYVVNINEFSKYMRQDVGVDCVGDILVLFALLQRL